MLEMRAARALDDIPKTGRKQDRVRVGREPQTLQLPCHTIPIPRDSRCRTDRRESLLYYQSPHQRSTMHRTHRYWDCHPEVIHKARTDWKEHVHPTPVQLKTVTDELAPTEGRGWLKVEYGGVSKLHEFWLATVQDPCILGSDFLESVWPALRKHSDSYLHHLVGPTPEGSPTCTKGGAPLASSPNPAPHLCYPPSPAGSSVCSGDGLAQQLRGALPRAMQMAVDTAD